MVSARTWARLRSMSTRCYADAIASLNTLQTNAAYLQSAAVVRPHDDGTRGRKLDEVVEYLSRLGYRPDDLNQLNVIHVTGTKGKGSTCAIVESILRHIDPTLKIGLYTSPHLVAVRERIRIGGRPISEDLFAKYFFEVWDRLGAVEDQHGISLPLRPMYFRFLTLMAYHVFLSLKVDATILEVGIGGLHDDTNVVPRPVVTAVSSIGYDHMNVLGKTLAEIAHQKGGIFKEGVPAYTVEQPAEPMKSLEDQAIRRKASSFEVVRPSQQLWETPIGLPGAHQVQNACLAVEAVKRFMQDAKLGQYGDETMSQGILKGLAEVRWPGRCQKIVDSSLDSLSWYLDGAHTEESLKCCVEWFVDPKVALAQAQPLLRVFIFNCTKGRSGQAFLQSVLTTIGDQLRKYSSLGSAETFFSHIVFCTNVTFSSGQFKGDLLSVNAEVGQKTLDVQKELANSWTKLCPDFPHDRIHILPSIEDSVTLVRSLDSQVPIQVLVTGSLHLVGGIIEVADLAKE